MSLIDPICTKRMEPVRWLKYLQIQLHSQEQTFVQKSCWSGDIVVSNDNPVIFLGIDLRNSTIDVVEFSAVAHRNHQNIDIMTTLCDRVDNGFDVIFAAWYCDADDQDSQSGRPMESLPQSAFSVA